MYDIQDQFISMSNYRKETKNCTGKEETKALKFTLNMI